MQQAGKLHGDLLEDVITISSREQETCSQLDCKLRQKYFRRHFVVN